MSNGKPASQGRSMNPQTGSGSWDVARAARVTVTVLAILALAVGLWIARVAILLTFAGLLLAIVLYGASRALSELTGLPRLVTLAGAVIAVAGALFGLIGLALATPLAAAAAVPLRHLYGTRKRDEPAAAEETAKAVPAG